MKADEIVPFVENSPVISFFYTKEAPKYADYKNPEGETFRRMIDAERNFMLAGLICAADSVKQITLKQLGT